MPHRQIPRLSNKPRAGVRAEARLADAGERPMINVVATDATAELYLYNEIGFYGISAGQFADAMNAHRGKAITLRINSPGGDVFDGLAMYSILANWPTPVTAQIDGLAASAASIVMLGAKSIQMTRGAFVMVHNAWGVAVGNAADLRDFAGVLDQIDGNLADLYSAKSGTPAADWLAMMAAETWLNSEQALEAKLIDSVIDVPAALARVEPGLYRNAPDALTSPPAVAASKRDLMAKRLDLVRRMA